MERQGSPSSSSCRRNSAMHLLRIDETVVVGRRGQGIVLIPPCDSASTFRDPRNYICWGPFFTGAEKYHVKTELMRASTTPDVHTRFSPAKIRDFFFR